MNVVSGGTMVSVLVSVITTRLVLGWRLEVSSNTVVGVSVERDGAKMKVDDRMGVNELVTATVSTMLLLGDRSGEVSSKIVDEGSSSIVVVGKTLVSG